MKLLKYLLAALLFVTPPVWGATTFIETPDATQGTHFWTTVVGDIAYDTALAKSGRASWRAKSGGGNAAAYVEKSNAVADAGTRASIYYYLTDSSLGAATKIWYAGTEIQIVLSTGRALSLTTNTGATTLKTGSTLAQATWKRLAIAYVVTSTTNFTIKVWVDGVLDMTATQADGTLSTTGQTTMGMGWGNAPGATKQLNFQHVYVDDSSALTDPGDIRVMAKRPFANGTTNNFVTQIGSGNSGYGSGHADEVNERALSTTNGWSVVAVGSAVTEEYNIQVASVGDKDLTNTTLVDYVGWVHAKALASETAQIIVNNVTSNISLTSTITTFTKVAGSTTYPAGTGTDIGIISSTDVTTVSLYEAGIMFAYIATGLGGPLAFDAYSTANDNGNVASTTLAHTCTGSNLVLLVGVAQDRNSVDPTVTGVTYNGNAMTQLSQGSSDFAIRTSLWIIFAPHTGANNVVVTYSATQTQKRTIHVLSYTGNDGTNDALTLVADTTDTDAATNTYTNSVSGDLVVDLLGTTTTGGGAPSVSGGQTQRGAVDNSGLKSGVSELAGAASVVMSWTWPPGSTQASRLFAVGLNPLAAAAGGVLCLRALLGVGC